ncbi:MAG: glutamate synthase large subunit [Chloroflexota bacterium]|nr:glutamate synthase large subunit [Chloroflexota bacterium]
MPAIALTLAVDAQESIDANDMTPGHYPNRASRTDYAGLHDPESFRDACGTGFIARLDGVATHRLVEQAVEGVVSLTHRGAVNADPDTGDGAGVTISIPYAILRGDLARLGHANLPDDGLALAMVFLPMDDDAASRGRTVLEQALSRTGLNVLGWRVVPTDPSVLGAWALREAPCIEQLLIARPSGIGEDEFGRRLYLARRRADAEYQALRDASSEDPAAGTYIVSMSTRTVVYKGLMVAPQLSRFYPDLTNPETVTSVALFHQRYATNTLPNWKIAQPFRYIAHNGEINTLLGNRLWMQARGPALQSDVWGDTVSELHPVLGEVGSDSQAFDEAFELLVASGRGPLHAMMMLIPEAWEQLEDMDPELHGFYEYHACLSEPWDGPAAMAFTDGKIAAAAMDRNGLRPARYQVTRSGLVVMGSEVGLIELDQSEIIESGRLGPGQMVAVDTERHEILRNDEIKRRVASQMPYSRWVRQYMGRLQRVGGIDASLIPQPDEGELLSRQILHGFSREEIEYVLKPMARQAKEPVGSMGDDTPLSVLHDPARPLYTYFKQKFAQVTNPPIDSIRERNVMSLDTWLGRRQSLLEEEPEAARLVHLRSPLLLSDELRALLKFKQPGFSAAVIDASFPVEDGPLGVEAALDALCDHVDNAIEDGHSLILLTDEDIGQDRAPIPMLLAVSTVHHHLIASGQRLSASIVANCGDARDVHQISCLIGFGADAVHPYLALQTLNSLHAEGEFDDMDADEVIERYVQAIDAGILKIMSKMGIAARASYHGAQIFEALGIGQEVVERSFPGTLSRIGGVGFAEIGADALSRHEQAYPADDLDAGGWYRYRRNADYHANEPPIWRALHKTVQGGGAEEYATYAERANSRQPTALRDMLDFKSDRDPVALDEVESHDAITPRFSTGAMSLGALSPETHEDIARAMNQLGAASNTGEGGEDPRRFRDSGDKSDANSHIKQIASGRFGVTPAYLGSAEEIEIKIAQGSKPGEGGQLPGHKVTAYIAMLRHSTPGVELISPPPHHDIYSIEDLSQLIYDLKIANPRARVCVKLVACEGVGTIATGVAKAYADVVHISGADGGTGASPLSSVKYAGAPWELGVKEAHEALVVNGLRGRIRLRTDGGFHTGRDVVIAAMLGAEAYGFGTAALVALGCKMARQCHLNTCPVGVATQREDLRAKYFGKPQMLIDFLLHVAEEVRVILSELGYRSIEEVIGRTDLLKQVPPRSGERAKLVDLTKLLAPIDADPSLPRMRIQERNDRNDDLRLDDDLLEILEPHIQESEHISAKFGITNKHRTVGARISGRIAQQYGDLGMQRGTIELHFSGSAGQSFGAFLVRGMRLYLRGEANDYVGKGMAGGMISVAPEDGAGFRGRDAVLVGNTVLYGATGGTLWVAGRAGERFAVRNSGARAVVEGVGDHGCEYMTGGTVVVLGPVGRNFAAGMSGGIAYVWDADGTLEHSVNPAMVDLERVDDGNDAVMLEEMIETHAERTGSPFATEILENWDVVLRQMVKVVPRDYKRVLRERAEEQAKALATQE